MLAFLYGYTPTTILFDEPDAHLHVNLQREILEYFRQKSGQTGTQFLIATHAEELVKGVDVTQIVSLLSSRTPRRVQSTAEILTAMADVSNLEITQLVSLPPHDEKGERQTQGVILYLEGEDDERILRAWARLCDAEDVFRNLCIHRMGGGDKKAMKDEADRHFRGLRQIIPHAKRLMLFDYDAEEAYHPERGNPAIYE